MSDSEYGTIIVIGGGCYGSYYIRQLHRGRAAGRITWRALVAVDRDPSCAVARQRDAEAWDVSLVVAEWAAYLSDSLEAALADPDAARADAIVPSPLMPHLMLEWLLARAHQRWPGRRIATVPLERAPVMPWSKAGTGGAHFVSFADWICPVNCIEPATCPKTKGPRSWSMPPALRAFVEGERSAGISLGGPLLFHCTHRAYGVGMFGVDEAVAADGQLAVLGATGPARVLVGTVSHCHGALGVIALD